MILVVTVLFPLFCFRTIFYRYHTAYPLQTQALYTTFWYLQKHPSPHSQARSASVYLSTAMDFLNPAKERRHRIALFAGYLLVAIAIAIASTVLLYASYGYTVDRKGDVQQRGLVFVSSQPTGASVSVDGVKKAVTNTKLELHTGIHTLRVSAEGYRSWERTIAVTGGDVQRYDYPFLIPTNLSTTTSANYGSAIEFATQSPNRKRLLVLDKSAPEQFSLMAINDPKKLKSSIVKVPDALITAGTGVQSWQPLEWASDSKNILFTHSYTVEAQTNKEYIVVNVEKPELSQNISKQLGLAQEEVVTLFDKKPDHFYGYSPSTKTLRSFTIESQDSRTILPAVLAYKTYANDTVLYVTSQPPSGKVIADQVSVVLQQGSRTTTLRRYSTNQPPDTSYLLDIARYDSQWYVTIGSTADKGVYVYKNPQTQVLETGSLPKPWRFISVASPRYVAFSDTARFILVQSGATIGVYDAEMVETKRYTLTDPMDSPQSNLSWMDGHRLLYVSQGKVVMMDYDNQNKQLLQPALPGFKPFLAPDFHTMYTLAPLMTDTSGVVLTQTALVAQ